ncbi:lactose-binding lectin l-2-like [Scomber japonicus]|uniref:lactose-binding lectin l-2-like n=1 Tax=Scomber japonicus TaxID=13676 RepID=UPI00230590C9|nr:lactose-binding lectin l-2-like [Scomber japonicus]
MLFLFLFLFGLALGTESPSSDRPVELRRGHCPPFWFSFNGRCYKYVSTDKTWSEAELHCVSERANLVSIHSQEEQDFVKFLIKNSDHAEGHTWIGLSDHHKEGRWMWSDGSAVNFVFWNPREPNNQGGHENCVHNNFDTGMKWNDGRCSDVHPSVCAFRKDCH